MNEFKKVVHIGKCKDGEMFAKVEVKAGNLSISGVIGPKHNGDATGSAGQFIMSFKEYDQRGYYTLADITPANGWNKSLVKKFFDIWDRWHLNDMKANCRHQVGPEWTHKDVYIYHYRLTREASQKQHNAKESAENALMKGETFTPTKEQAYFASLPYSITLPTDTAPKDYEPAKPLYNGDHGHKETKNTGWLTQDQHPEGFLSKPCPVCGYKYGSAWLKEELPQDVIDFLMELPDTDIKPAWV